MKKILSVWISACLSAGAMAQSALAFDANAGVKSKMTVYTGRAPKAILDPKAAILTDAIRQNVRLMNPMSFIGDGKTSVAPHWYIRHGARNRDTAFPVPLNFATKLQNAGKDVNFLLAWNRPHSGDYALDELFEWMNKITK